jgi:L-gulonate 5-dehydrogenase
MLAAVTRSPGVLVLDQVAEPGPPGRQDVIIRPEVVGVCCSDLRIYSGQAAARPRAGSLLPLIQGHELCAVIEETGRDCPGGLRAGERVAVWPTRGCGRCYPCRVGRPNACATRELVGVDRDGGLQQLLRVPESQVYPVGDLEPGAGAFVQPMSVAVRALQRAEIRAGQQVVVLGAGPIGLAVVMAASAAGARVMAADPVPGRRELATRVGAECAAWGSQEELLTAARRWARREGPPRVVDTTGDPAALAQAAGLVCPAGRVVVVGMPAGAAPLRAGLLAEKEIDIAGSSCATAADFRSAVRLVRAHRESVAALLTHRFPLRRARAAFECVGNPAAGAVKVLISVGS